MPDSGPSQPRAAARIPLETKVDLEFEKFSGFISEYSSNISQGGMYIKTKDTKPVGTILSFEFRLRDNFKLIQGLGEVVWVRTADQGPGKSAGMGVRFHELDERSRELIGTMVNNYIKGGGKPFELEPPSEGAAASPPKSPPPSAEATTVEEDFKALFAEPDASEAPTVKKPMPVPPPSVIQPAPLEDKEDLFSDTFTSGPLETPEPPVEKAPPKSPPPLPETHLAPEEIPPADLALSSRLEPPETLFEEDKAPSRLRKVVPWVVVLTVLLAGGYFGYGPLMSWLGFGVKTTEVAVIEATPVPTAAPTTAPTSLPTSQPTAVPTSPPTRVPTAAPTPLPTVRPTPVPTPEKIAVARAITKVERITWSRKNDQTVLTIWTNGAVSSDSYSRSRVEGKFPREVIKFTGISKPFPRAQMWVRSPELSKIRTGFHRKDTGNELHVVLDLAYAKAKVLRAEPSGSKLVLYLAGK